MKDAGTPHKKGNLQTRASGEKTHSTQRVATSRRNTQGNRRQSPRSEQRWEVPTHTSPWEGEPNAKAHNQTRQEEGKPPVRPQAEEHSSKIPQARTEVPKTSAKNQGSGVNPQPRQHCLRYPQEPAQQPAAQTPQTEQEEAQEKEQRNC